MWPLGNGVKREGIGVLREAGTCPRGRKQRSCPWHLNKHQTTSTDSFVRLAGIIITRKTADCGVVRRSKYYPRTLGTEARPIGVVVHERDLLRWLICDIEVILDAIQSPSVICSWAIYLVEDQVKSVYEWLIASLQRDQFGRVLRYILGIVCQEGKRYIRDIHTWEYWEQEAVN